MSGVRRLIALAETFLAEADQIAWEPLPYDSSKTAWGHSGMGYDYHKRKYADEFKAELQRRADLRMGIQQELPFTIHRTPQGMGHAGWSEITRHKPRNEPGHRWKKTSPYRDEKWHATLADWHKAASDVLVKHGFKRNPEHDVYGGGQEGTHQSRHTAWQHPSGARVTLGHHVHRTFDVSIEDHPDLGRDNGHTVYWAYRNDKSRSWGSRSTIGEFGEVPDRSQRPEYRRGRTVYPTRKVSRTDAAARARKKEGWELVSHSLRALGGVLGELHPEAGKKPTGTPVTQIAGA